MKCRIRWTGERQLVAESETGHGIVLDTPAGFGGRNTGPTPMELMLLGTAGCTAVDVVYILGDRMHTDLTALEVEAEAERAESEPKVFTAVHLRYGLQGRGVKDKQITRAISLSMTKYCSASAMVAHTARFTAAWTYRDLESGEERTGELAVEHGGGGSATAADADGE
jgi:putative redox protein